MPERPAPVPDRLTLPFWEACAGHRLTVPECQACGRRFFVPEVVCPACLSSQWEWADSAGLGTVYSLSVVYRTAHPNIDTPFILAIVDLDDGWSMLTNIVGCEPDSASIGMPVAVTFSEATRTGPLPCFAPVPTTL
jgi:uncharacterized OB-fold protein